MKSQIETSNWVDEYLLFCISDHLKEGFQGKNSTYKDKQKNIVYK